MELNLLTESIIGAAIEVHRELGPGLLENIYSRALGIELATQGIPYDRELRIPILYRGELLAEHRIDLVVEQQVIVELKAVERMLPLFAAQILSYMKVAKIRVGLLVNFNVPVLPNGLKRFVL